MRGGRPQSPLFQRQLTWQTSMAMNGLEQAYVPSTGNRMLRPILVAGYGRSGTSAVMKILAADPQVVFDREYPYEIRYLAYYAKLSSILKNRPPDARFTSDHLYTFDESVFGPWPWHGHNAGHNVDWLRIFWDLFSSNARAADQRAEFYAEKAPMWLTPMVRPLLPCFVINLFRDPRDVYLSSNAFMKRRGYYGFHRNPDDTNLAHARSLGLELVNYFENFTENGVTNQESFILRYEDLISHPEEFLAWLRSIGLTLDLNAAFSQVEEHQTASTLGTSVWRWHKEYIPPEVSSFFERHLGREMVALGYSREGSALCPQIEFRTGQPIPQLCNPNHGVAEMNENSLTVRIAGNDFGILVPSDPFQADDAQEVWVSATGDVGDHCSIYWRNTDSDFSEERSLHVNFVPGSHWRILRFCTCQHPLWTGKIHQLRLDLFNGTSPAIGGTGHVRWIRLIQ
jgi:Sulfotransferase family